MMNIWYTSRGKFTSNNSGWESYIEWSGLNNVSTKLISLDTNLCEPCIEPDFDDAHTYEVGLTTEGGYFAYCYNSIAYVINKTPATSAFNLLAVAFNPEQDCNDLELQGFDFIGYDLIDQSNDTSAVTNCGGFEDVFSNDILNKHGLISSYATATELCTSLLEMHPEEYHADTNVWAVWKMRS